MNIIERMGGHIEANSLLKNPLANRATDFDLKLGRFLCRLERIQTKAWRHIINADEEVTIDDPDPKDLINIGELCKALVSLNSKPISAPCIIWNEFDKAFISSIAAKGKAFYYTINIDDAMRTTVDECGRTK
ncbi:hypothetical protein NGC85_17050 (plasmid) [Acinetobacter sp. Z1]|uniref:hypothetical protein n=1 Tax=Acinetobacter sp. Z1 TaxID=2953738 RepID=UPI0020C94700|nr:hypothetical protein [Acinetobacter sp. Z1]UTO21294.1 hypothetical protein NGC85_17050 [Acinetobacter sp. Z1]